MNRRLAFAVVAAQILLIVALVVLPLGMLWPVNGVVIGAALVLGVAGALLIILGVIGLGPAVTVSPIPREQAPLVTTGVYGVIRSPIYTGLMTAGFGFTLYGASVWHIVVWVVLVVLLSAKARWEERMLVARHPEYAAYGARVGRFLPRRGRL